MMPCHLPFKFAYVVRSLIFKNLSSNHRCCYHKQPSPPPSLDTCSNTSSTSGVPWNHPIHKSRFDPKNPRAIVDAFKQMLQTDAKPNGITFSIVTRALSTLRELNSLMGIHVLLLRLGFHSDIFALNTLLDAYLACGCINIARKVFDEMPKRDVVAWTMLMNGYVRNGRASEAIKLFFSMKEEGVRSDGMVFVAIFNACGQVKDLTLARELERSVAVASVEDDSASSFYDIHVMNCLVAMYAKCGSMEDGRRIFNLVGNKDTVTWNTMVSGYAGSGMMAAAREIFHQIPVKNEVSWSALLNGYVQNGEFREALHVFNEMREREVVANNATLTSAITACAHLGGLDLGREIHSGMDEHNLLNDVVLSTALVDMYAKCGCLETSIGLFHRIKKKTVVTWNVMIIGMATHGNAPGCFDLFTRLLRAGLTPSGETFLGVLLGCAHSGWLDEGKNLFVRMTCVYGIIPQIEHCSCMVQLIGHAGLLDEAYEFIQTASFTPPDVTLWGALLTACNIHGDVQLGEFVARRILELDPLHSGAYVQLSSIYAKAGMWREVMDIRSQMREMGIKNRPGRSSFELDGTVHEFFAGEDSHPMIEQIISVLNGIDTYLLSID